MAVKFRKEAIKFLQKLNPEDTAKIQSELNQLIVAVEEKGIIPFTDLDIKKMKGEWAGFYRLRIGKIRVVFSLKPDSTIEIYTIGARGDAYK